LLFAKSIKNAKNILISGKHGLRYKVPNIKESIGFNIFADGIYEPETSAMIIQRLPRQGIFMDIGANIGSISLPVAKHDKVMKVICIEASPFVFPYLVENVRENGLDNCILVNKAVSDSDNEQLDFYSPKEFYGQGSMGKERNADFEIVNTITIDSLVTELNIPTVDVIKIDIEGYEYFAFKGAAALLRTDHAPDIIFEFLDAAEGNVNEIKKGAAQNLLLRMGYSLYEIGRGNRLKKLIKPLIEGGAMLLATKRNNHE
jgi:FkbM family methyltransferase